MTFLVKDRVQETCSAPGTGTVSLLGAVSGYQTFSSAIGDTNTTFYTIADQAGSNWEVGVGTYSSSGNVLARTIILASSNGGSVVNFSSGTQNVWCDYAAGKAILLDPNGKLNAGNQGYLDWASITPTLAAGRMWYDASIGAWQLGMTNGNVAQKVGLDQFYYIKASSAITKGQVVMFTGSVGASGVLTGAPATGVTNGSYIMGIAAESIALNGFGFIQSFGILKGIDTSMFTAPAILWYDPANTGGLTATQPVAPNIKVQMAAVIYSGSSGSGSIQIRVNSGSVLGGTDSNVQFGTLATNDLIQYNGTYWTNVNASSISVGYATNLNGGAAGGIPYQTGPNATTFLAASTNGYVLTLVGGVPSWQPGGSSVPSGSAMLFYQASAPTGWTQVTTLNDYDLRLVSGSGGSTGGTTAYSTVFSNQTPTISSSLSVGATTLDQSMIPSHTHSYFYYTGGGNYSSGPWQARDPGTTGTTGATGGGGSHSHSIGGSISSSAITLNVRYANIILCTKN